MEEYMKIFKEYIREDRNYTKTMFKIMSTLYRATQNGRTTWEQGLKQIKEGGIWYGCPRDDFR